MALFRRRQRTPAANQAATTDDDAAPSPPPTVDVFADITCPFTHVGLQRVVPMLSSTGRAAVMYVKAWPLEWVNGQPLQYDAVASKSEALTAQLGGDSFRGLDAGSWPSTTIPALAMVANAYVADPATGLALSIDLRRGLFELGRDISDPDVLADYARSHALHSAIGHKARLDGEAIVRDDYEEGQRLGVDGSPHFFVGSSNFFCPALDIGHDADGALTARLDTDGLDEFLSQLATPAEDG
ncbi:MAG: DsbA family protein [Actinomycetota bacterium]